MSATVTPTPVKTQGSKKKSNRKAIAGAVGGVLVLGLAAGLAWAYWPKPKVAPTAEPEKVLAFMASDRWKGMPAEELQKYFDEMEKDPGKYWQKAMAMPEADREKMREFMEQKMVNDARKYAKLSPEEKTKELDKQIDRMEEMRKNFRPPTTMPATRPGGPGGPGGRGWGGGAAGQKGRMENMAPGDRAAMTQMFSDMMARRAARGVGGGFGPGGGGGGGARPGGGK